MKSSFRKHPMIGLFTLALAAPACATSYPAATNPTRTVGAQPDGSYVASSNQLLTPAGKLVSLGAPVSVKSIAQNPVIPNQAAVLLMDSDYPIAIINTKTGEVLQYFVPVITSGSGAGQTYTNVSNGSFTGVTYSPDGTKLLFSQDAYSATFGGYLTVAAVNPTTGLLTPSFSVQLPNPTAVSSTTSIGVPGTPALPNFNAMYNPYAVNPAGIAVTPDNATALVALNANNSVGIVPLASKTVSSQIPVGNAPNQVIINAAGTFAYVTNEGGRSCGTAGSVNNPLTSSCGNDFTDLSDGTGIVADSFDGYATTGTVSVIQLANAGGAVTGSVVATINVGLHPAGMALSADGTRLFVANSYSDTISVIDTKNNKVVRTIAVPAVIPGGAFGAGVNGITLDPDGATAYVSMGQSNAVAVVNLTNGKVSGYVPTAYFPSAITFDPNAHTIVVANDKGLGAQGYIVSDHGVEGYNTHEEQGDVSLIPVPKAPVLRSQTQQVIINNNWNSPYANFGTPNPQATPLPVPTTLGNPSPIKHVFLFIKENRTYDQILGDVAAGNGDPSLAIFGYDTPNQHAIVSRFPLLDNTYAPSRQSADGHPWIVTGGSFYSNDILSPDWIRSYPGGNSDDALTYTQRGFLWSGAEKAGLSVHLYGEYTWFYQMLGNSSVVPTSITGQPYYPETNVYSWAQWFAAHECSGYFTQTPSTSSFCTSPATNPITTNATDTEFAAVPSINVVLDQHYPSFNLNIPDQVRADYFIQELNAQTAANNVPALSIIWLPDDHTNGTGSSYPSPNAYQADNDLALGRMVEAISNSNVWGSTAIFVEEDDSQDGVDHVDGHREPVYVISPYAAQTTGGTAGPVIHTTYTAANINRTIEQILGYKPMTQFDTVASPMFDAFNNVPGAPSAAALAPFTHVPASIPLNVNASGAVIANSSPTASPLYASTSSKVLPIQKAWEQASEQVMKGHESQADAVDEKFLDHVVWYSATKFSRPYPGESKVLPPDAFLKKAAQHPGHDSDD